MNVQHYLNRINYEGALRPELNVLKHLQKAHLLSVPFENLDIHYGNSIEPDTNKIYKKVIDKKRGGFCYELNGLFNELLKAIGFSTKIISARVYNNEKQTFGQEYDHLAILVLIDEKTYLTDVGFGEFVFHPLEIELGKIQSDPRGDFIIETHENGYLKVSKLSAGEKITQYIFSTTERAMDEFSGMCTYHQTCPNSHFTQKKLISKPTENGRITISGTTLKVTENGVTTTETTFAEDTFGTLLLKCFGLDESKIDMESAM